MRRCLRGALPRAWCAPASAALVAAHASTFLLRLRSPSADRSPLPMALDSFPAVEEEEQSTARQCT